MAKKITRWQAAEILGISDRHMRRIRERYVKEGYNGLLDRRRGKSAIAFGDGGKRWRIKWKTFRVHEMMAAAGHE